MLRVRNLDVCYGLFQALFDVSLETDSGACLALIGANGAGKTTLLRAIAGALDVTSGSISLAGTPLAGGPETKQIECGIALVPEGRRLFADLTVKENIQ